jgi:hypothetical protein
LANAISQINGLLYVLAVIALAVFGESKQALFQDRIALAPQSQREAQALAIMRNPAESVLAPAVGA